VVLKLLRSALANARNKKIDVSKLIVSSVLVNQGPMMKRFLPRAQGRATPLQKKTSHIILTLTESDQVKPARFNIQPPVRKEKKEKAKKIVKPKTVEAKETKATVEEKPGFFRKVFRRKSV
jgi:large subunit ribosomal protein L22